VNSGLGERICRSFSRQSHDQRYSIYLKKLDGVPDKTRVGCHDSDVLDILPGTNDYLLHTTVVGHTSNATTGSPSLYDEVEPENGLNGEKVFQSTAGPFQLPDAFSHENGSNIPNTCNSSTDSCNIRDSIDLECGISGRDVFSNFDANSAFNDHGYSGVFDQWVIPAAPLISPFFQPNLNMPTFTSAAINPIQPRTPCPWVGCSESFVRSTDVQRHWDAVHLGIKYHCFWVGCPNNGGKGYCRLEKLRTHQRQKHGLALM
jgi:hypothetical protein